MITRNNPSILRLINLVGAAVVFIGWWPVPGYFLLEPALYCGIAVLCLVMLPVTEVHIHRRTLLAYAAFLAWVVFSDAISGEYLAALARDFHWLILPLLVVLYAQLFARSGDTLKVLQLAVALSLPAIFFYLLNAAGTIDHWVYENPIFGNVRRMAMTAGLMIVFLYYDAGYREKWLLTLARTVGLGLLFWSGSRGAILAWGLGLLTFAWHTGQWSRLRAWSLEAAAALFLAILFDVGDPQMGILGGVFLRTWSKAVVGGTVDVVSSGRVAWWLKTLGALQDPQVALLGAGGNGFVRLELWYRQIFHPHNIILQVLTDWGAGGLLLLSWLVKEGMPKCLGRTGKDSVAGLGLALMVFLLVMGLLDGGLYHLQYLFFASIAIALIASAAPVERCVKPIAIPRLGIAVLLFASMFLHWSMRDYRSESPMHPLRQHYVAPIRGGQHFFEWTLFSPARSINNPLIPK